MKCGGCGKDHGVLAKTPDGADIIRCWPCLLEFNKVVEKSADQQIADLRAELAECKRQRDALVEAATPFAEARHTDLDNLSIVYAYCGKAHMDALKAALRGGKEE
jgi:hypothetical protein